MAVSRHGSGRGATARALASQIHPVFMLPPLATSLFGAILAGDFSVLTASVHTLAIFFAVYTAHIKDGYVDFYVRGEDDDHPLTAGGCRTALVGASLAFACCLVALWWLVGPGAALITLPAWLIAYHHAPQLDMNPVGVTAGYPAGIAVATLGGYYVQTRTLGPVVLAFAGVFFVLLLGVKTIDDVTDYDYDRSIDKRTVAVVIGLSRARRVAYGLMVLASLGVVGFVAAGLFPPATLLGVAAFAVVAVFAHGADAKRATMMLIRAAYLFLAVLFFAVWFRPLG